MSWAYVAAAAVTVVGGVVSSNKSKQQAKIQAQAIEDAGGIDSIARNKAISQVLEVFSPSLAEFNASMQGSIDMMEQGRISTGDLLQQSAQNVSSTIQQGGQSALNAMLGLPSPENVPTAQPERTTGGYKPPREQLPQNQPAVDSAPLSGIGNQTDDISYVATDGGINPQGINLRSSFYDPSVGGVAGLYPKNPEAISAPQADQSQPSFSAFPQDYNPEQMGPFAPGSPGAIADQARIDALAQANSAFQPQEQLTGELMPRDYNFEQQSINMPQGTDAGLIGARNAVQQGADLGKGALARGATGALESLNTQTGIARDDISQGRDFALNKVQQAIQAGRQGINQGVNSIQQGTEQGVNAINSGVNQATGYLNPYMSAGKEALNPLLDLSGVRGQEAFDAARMNDPAYNLAIQESERALGRNAAVTGGVGSGNTKARFQENAQQQAAADIDRQLGRFRAITDRGQQAASTAGGFATQGGIASGNLINQGGIASGGLQARGGELEANQLNRMGDVGIQSSQQLSQIAQRLGLSESQVLQQLGSNMANIDVGTGQQIGGMNESAGINAANIIRETSGQQANTEQNLSQQLAGLDQDTLNNIVNSIQSGSGTNLQSNQQLATILANLGIGAGTSAANTAIDLGRANASGVTNPWGNAANTIAGLYASGAFNNSSQPTSATQPTNYSPNQFDAWSPTNQGGI